VLSRTIFDEKGRETNMLESIVCFEIDVEIGVIEKRDTPRA
jgi:hypothetical protein